MLTTSLDVYRYPDQLIRDDRRVITRYLDFGSPRRIRSILSRVMRIPDARVPEVLAHAMENFSHRHDDVRSAFLGHYNRVARFLRPGPDLSDDRRLLIGAYFTMEYSIESAALFNPSMVIHPNQEGVPNGSLRFLMSLRATGEGHVSSIVFRRGIIDADGGLAFDPPPRFAHSARPIGERVFKKMWFLRKLRELELDGPLAEQVLDALPDPFSRGQLVQHVSELRRTKGTSRALRRAASHLRWLAQANYELRFPDHYWPAEIVIFPATESEQRGMEDLRLVRFVDETARAHYYGTYTAYDGRRARPMLLETIDFTTFHVATLGGRYIRNKGLALFPRKVGGAYMMAARHDGENIFLLESDDVHSWNRSRLIQRPSEPWEMVQLGNCGSPLETEAGWLLLTHGVGPVRQYCIGAVLLDRDDPGRLIGRLRQPLLVPNADEREGYVPNVVYSCGSAIHGDRLIIPYAMSDSRTSFAAVPLHQLLDRLRQSGP